MSMSMSMSTTRTPYRLKLHHIETCSCDVNCMCQFAGGPVPNGYCQFMIGFQVIDGSVGDVTLTGVKFVVAAKYPKAIHNGDGHVILFVDDDASSGQADALAQVLTGRLGGMPWEALAATMSTFEGPVRKPIEMTVQGTRSSFRIPGVLEVRQTPLTDVVTGVEKEIHITYPKGGFLWNDGSIAKTASMRMDFGSMSFHHEGHYAASAEANWTNEG